MTRFIAPALLVLTGLAAQAFAQAVTERPTTPGAGARTDATTPADRAAGQPARTQPGAAAQAGQGNPLDQQIAVCLTLGNQEEVQLGQFAQDRAQNPQVKQFAQMMVEEHQQAVSKLQQAMPHLASLKLELNAQGATARAGATGATTSANQRNSATGAQAGGQQQMVEFAKEVKQECLNLTTQELGRKQGADFDKCYIGQQLVAHTGMLAELKTAQRHVTNEQLRPIIQQGTQMTEHHLAQARQIMEQLDAGGQRQPAGQAQRPETPATPRR
jgi:predicted outer membrane protein